MIKLGLLTPAQVAAMLSVSPITVRSWVTKGWLNSVTTPGGHRRFLYSDVVRFMGTRGIKKSSLKVLVVDDDDLFRELMVETIHEMDEAIAVKQAEDGFKAGMVMSEFMPDIVLIDYDMPNLNGADVCRRIKSNPLHAKTRVIGITGHASAAIESDMMEAGADTVLRKPFEISQLIAVLRQK